MSSAAADRAGLFQTLDEIERATMAARTRTVGDTAHVLVVCADEIEQFTRLSDPKEVRRSAIQAAAAATKLAVRLYNEVHPDMQSRERSEPDAR